MSNRKDAPPPGTASRILDTAEALVQTRGFNGFSYADVLRLGRMCLCGMLAADYDTLPEAMRGAVVLFFDANERWLAGVLEQGRTDGTLEFAGSASEVAQSIVSGLEGALLIARPYHDVARFQAAADRLIAGLAQTTARHR